MRIFLTVITYVMSAFSLFGQGQKDLLAKWEMHHEQLCYFQIDSVSNEQSVLDVSQVDTGKYSINGYIFYKTKKLSATFPGGQDSLKTFIRNNLEFQPYNGVYPRVIIAFIINVKGDIIYPGILRGAESKYNQAALSLIKKMPQWIPANKDGAAVPTFNTLIIDFTIR